MDWMKNGNWGSAIASGAVSALGHVIDMEVREPLASQLPWKIYEKIVYVPLRVASEIPPLASGSASSIEARLLWVLSPTQIHRLCGPDDYATQIKSRTVGVTNVAFSSLRRNQQLPLEQGRLWPRVQLASISHLVMPRIEGLIQRLV